MVLTTYIILFALPMLALLALARNIEVEGLIEVRDAVILNVSSLVSRCDRPGLHRAPAAGSLVKNPHRKLGGNDAFSTGGPRRS